MARTATMKQQKALADGRQKRASNLGHKKMIDREILSLRSQIGQEMSKGHASGINLTLGDIDEEYVPDLRRLSSRTRMFERMANDPQIRGQLRAINMTMISGVRWKVEGGTNEMRDLVAANILREGPPELWNSSSWLDLLYEGTGCLIYGFTLFGKTRAVVGDKMIFSDLSWLHPRSVDEDGWVMDEDDNLLAIKRSFTDAKGRHHTSEPLPISEAFLMCWDRRGPNWEGNAFIRPMYRPWLLNEMAEKIDIIDLQNRGIGIPVAHLSGAGGVKERDTLIQILKSLRGGSKERAFIVLEKDEKISYLLSEGDAKDAGPTLAHHKQNIVKTAGTEYFEQGNTATGSRAGASALATGFFINVDAIKTQLEDMFNFGVGRMPGLVQELIDMNFDNPKEYPRLVGSRVSPTEQLDNIPLVQDSVQKGLIPPHRKLANEALRRLGWPELSEEEYAEGQSSRMPSIGGRPTEAGPDDKGRDDTEGRRVGMAEKKTLPGEIQLRRSPESWHWLKSRAG